MNCNQMKVGAKVVVTQLESTEGMTIADKHLTNRRVGATGILKTWVPGHGGDVWFVEHDEASDGQERVAAYCFTELELVEN